MTTTPKVALVTGASSGFGQATAARLSAQGFLVFGTSRAPAYNEASGFELLPLDVRMREDHARPVLTQPEKLLHSLCARLRDHPLSRAAPRSFQASAGSDRDG